MTDPTMAAAAVGIVALALDFLRERRLEQLDDHGHRLRAIERRPLPHAPAAVI